MGMVDMGRRFAALGEEEMCDVIRFWTMSAAEYLDEYFETDLMKAHLAGSGIIGTALGPCSPGSAYVLLHHYMGEVDGHMGAWGFARGGMGAVSEAIASAFQEAGGEIRVDAPVDQVIVRDGQVEGVALIGGDEVRGKVVLSNLDVKNTFLNVMDPADLPADFLHRVKHFKARGSSGKLNIALDGVPEFPSIPKECSNVIGGDLGLIGTMEELERAYDDWKAGTWSRRPFLDIMIPTLTDPTMAPPGKHYMSIFVQYAPPHLANGVWDDDNRKAFGDTVIDLVAEFSPNFKDLILDVEVRSPQDIEDEVGITEGNIFHGELTMDQLLFNRPVPGYAQYRGPVAGMYMCGLEQPSWRRRHGRAGGQRRPRSARRPEDCKLKRWPPPPQFDAIIVGAGHNGLTCAAYLTRAGRRVAVLEAGSQVGGAAVSAEFHPGYTVSSCAHILHLLHPKVLADLQLARHGLRFSTTDMATVALDEDGRHITLSSDEALSSASIAAHSEADARGHGEFRRRMVRFAGVLQPALAAAPPRLGGDWRDKASLAKLAWGARRLGREDMREFMRIIGMNAADLLEEVFETDVLRGAYALDSVLGARLGPRSPNSVLTLFYRLAGEQSGVRGNLAHPAGGMGAVSRALAGAASRADIRTDTAVTRIIIEDDRAVGVELASGEQLFAGCVVSGANPRATFLDLVGPAHLDTGFVRRVKNIRMGGVAAKINLAPRRPAGVQRPRRRRARRPAAHRPERRLCGARLQPLQIRRVLRGTGDRDHHSLGPRRRPGARWRPCAVGGGPVRALRPQGGLGQCPRGLRRPRRRNHDPLCPRPATPHRRPPDHHAAGPGARLPHDRGPLAPRRAGAGSKCSCCARCPATPSTRPRFPGSTCAAPGLIPAAASWARRAITRPNRLSIGRVRHEPAATLLHPDPEDAVLFPHRPACSGP